MFDVDFPGTYQQYKSGTTKVINWLFENAVTCGYQPVNTESAPKKKTTRTKKGGKNVRRTPAPPTYDIKAWELPAIAEAIANSHPKVEIPAWFPVVLDKVISGRKDAADWYAVHSDKSTKAADDRTHRYFILLLEEVRQILKPILPRAKGSEGGLEHAVNNEDDAALEKSQNLFEVLEIEEVGKGTYPEPQSSTSEKPKATFTTELTAEEKSFAIYCFFEDFRHVRQHVKGTWQSYELGNIDVATAALVTNTAFELFQRFENDLVATMPDDLKDQGFEHLLRELRAYSNILDEETGRFSCHYYTMADSVCLPIYEHLAEYLDGYKAPMFKSAPRDAISLPNIDEKFVPTLNLCECELSPPQKFYQDRTVLLGRLLPGFCCAAMVKFVLPVEDELTKEVREMMRQRALPIWLVLAFQVYLDINYRLTSTIDRGLEDFLKFGRETLTSIDTFLEYSSPDHRDLESWTGTKQDDIRSLRRELSEFESKDCVGDSYAKGQIPKTVLNADLPLTYPSLRRNPVSFMPHFSTGVLIQWRPVIRTLHLYNAARRELPSLVPESADFEAFTKIHTDAKVFIGARPTNPKEYLTRYCLQNGSSGANFASDSSFVKRGDLLASSRRARVYTLEPPVSAIYWDRCCVTSDGRTTLTLETLEKNFKAPEGTAAKDIASISDITDDLGDTSLQASGGSERKKRRKRQAAMASRIANSHKLTPVQLLTALEDSLEEQRLSMTYDYLSLHMRCHRILVKIKSALDPKILDRYGLGEGEADLVHLPLLILSQVLSLSAGSRALGVSMQEL